MRAPRKKNNNTQKKKTQTPMENHTEKNKKPKNKRNKNKKHEPRHRGDVACGHPTMCATCIYMLCLCSALHVVAVHSA